MSCGLQEMHLGKYGYDTGYRELSWNPRWDIQKALEKIIIWHKAWLSCENLNEITIDHINEYTITNPL